MNFVFHRTYYTKTFCLKKKKQKKNVYRSFIYINKLYIIGGGLPPPNLLYGISTIRFLKIANLITS